MKLIHRRIKDRLLAKVEYPYYILGGIESDRFTERGHIQHAQIHAGHHILFSEDIKSFFPNTKSTMVLDIWQGLFRFHPDVASVLTQLTTYEGSLPQGWVTSNHLANLALWRHEPETVARLEAMGLIYSRFVDDMTGSSQDYLSAESKTAIVREMHSLIARCGYRMKRTKHDIASRNTPMKVVNLNVNSRRPTIPKKERSDIRLAVYQCENWHPGARNSAAFIKLWDQTSGRVSNMARLHPIEAQKLRKYLNTVKPQRVRKTKIPAA